MKTCGLNQRSQILPNSIQIQSLGLNFNFHSNLLSFGQSDNKQSCFKCHLLSPEKKSYFSHNVHPRNPDKRSRSTDTLIYAWHVKQLMFLVDYATQVMLSLLMAT
jgi:hypothetical protein